MKPAVVFVIAFVVATGASTGAKVALSKPAASAAGDSTKAHSDSTKTDSAAVAGGAPGTADSDSAKAVAAAADTSRLPAIATPLPASPAASQPAATPAPSAQRTTPGANAPAPIGPPKPITAVLNAKVAQQGSSASAAVPPAASARSVPDTSSERRVSKVFASMDPKTAAKVLEHMADQDIEIILGYVGSRQAASIMAALPPERVATLSKLSMQGKK